MESSLFERAVAAFDAVNAEDPSSELQGGTSVPRELAHAHRLAAWIERLSPDASEALRLAAHCQHIARFRVPRTSYPEGRVGYLRWRTELGRRHADIAEGILREVGYDQEMIQAVRRINLKQGLRRDPDTQTMEDALCLSFLEHEYPEFCDKHPDDKLITILQKTWRKMSERAHKLAHGLKLEGRPLALLERALSEPSP